MLEVLPALKPSATIWPTSNAGTVATSSSIAFDPTHSENMHGLVAVNAQINPPRETQDLLLWRFDTNPSTDYQNLLQALRRF
jgi:hypothetical protein